MAELICTDAFSDFFHNDYLLSEGYKDPADVLGGGVPEQNLRASADKIQVSTTMPDGKPKLADTLNSDFVKSGIYHKTIQKMLLTELTLETTLRTVAMINTNTQMLG